MRHSGWYPDYVLRLFRRGKARFDDVVVHERVICDGPVKRLASPLLHAPVHRLEDALSRIDRYSTASAQAFTTSSSASRTLSPGTHDATRARIGTNGKNRRPSLATPL